MGKKSFFALILFFIVITLSFQNCGAPPAECLDSGSTGQSNCDPTSATTSAQTSDRTWEDYAGVLGSSVPTASGGGSGGITTSSSTTTSSGTLNSQGVGLVSGSISVTPSTTSFSFSKDLIDIDVTVGVAFSFTVAVERASGPVTYDWYKKATNSTAGFTKLSGETKSALIRYPAVLSDDGYYYVEAKDGTNVIKSREVRLRVTEIKGDCASGQYAHQWENPAAGAIGGGTDLGWQYFFQYSTYNPVYHYFLNTRQNTYITNKTYLLNDLPMITHGNELHLEICKSIPMPNNGINDSQVRSKIICPEGKQCWGNFSCAGAVKLKCENKKFRFIGHTCKCQYTTNQSSD